MVRDPLFILQVVVICHFDEPDPEPLLNPKTDDMYAVCISQWQELCSYLGTNKDGVNNSVATGQSKAGLSRPLGDMGKNEFRSKAELSKVITCPHGNILDLLHRQELKKEVESQ